MPRIELEDPDIAILLAITVAISAGIAAFVKTSFRPALKELGKELPLAKTPVFEVPDLPELQK